MMDCERAAQPNHLQLETPIPERADDGAMESEDGSSKLWDRVAADDRRIGSEECLKLWMELEARCGDGRVTECMKDVVDGMVPLEPKCGDRQPLQEANNGDNAGNDGHITMRLGAGGVVEETSNGDRQGSTNREKEEWSPAEVITLLEAYEQRLGDVRAGNLRGKEWEEVAVAVNQHCDGNTGANKSLKQCKRKVYALRRWYKSVFSRQMTSRQDGYEHTLLCVLERIMTPSSACRAGIPGGIDAGERQSAEPLAPSLFDEEDEEAELIQATRAVMPPKLGGGFVDAMVSSMQSGKRTGMGTENDRKRKAEQSPIAGTTDSNFVENGNLSKKPCMSSCCDATSHSGGVISALNSFVKVLAQVEQKRMEIMKDLDRRRTELQMKLANLEPYQEDHSDTSPPSAMLTLL